MRYFEFNEAITGKIIAYHGTGTRITQFYQRSMAGHFFTQDKEYAKGYVGGKTSIVQIDKPKKTRNYLLTVELDIKHMFDTKDDHQALDFYNTQFVPYMNTIHLKYHQPPLPILAAGNYVSFAYADELFRYMTRFDNAYDGMLVDEAIVAAPAIVPFNASQIKIIKTEIVKFS